MRICGQAVVGDGGIGEKDTKEELDRVKEVVCVPFS